jgi:hypothetical protein
VDNFDVSAFTKEKTMEMTVNFPSELRSSESRKKFPMVLGVGFFALCMCVPVFHTVWAHEGKQADQGQVLLPGQRIIEGVVEEVKGDQARVDIGEAQPRFVPLSMREPKGLPALKKGDRVTITVNDQNLVVDVHLPEEKIDHKIVRGTLAQPLATGHEKAVIQATDGSQQSYFVGPLARSKVASMPVGTEILILIDEREWIVDATFGSEEAVEKAQQTGEKKSPPKASFKKVTGVIKDSLQKNMIAIQKGNEEQQYEVRSMVTEKFKDLSPGQSVVLFLDDEDKVTDVSFPK